MRSDEAIFLVAERPKKRKRRTRSGALRLARRGNIPHRFAPRFQKSSSLRSYCFASLLTSFFCSWLTWSKKYTSNPSIRSSNFPCSMLSKVRTSLTIRVASFAAFCMSRRAYSGMSSVSDSALVLYLLLLEKRVSYKSDNGTLNEQVRSKATRRSNNTRRFALRFRSHDPLARPTYNLSLAVLTIMLRQLRVSCDM